MIINIFSQKGFIMFKIFIKLVFITTLSVGLYAQSGLSQNYLLSVSPDVSAEEVSAESTVEIVFDLPIAEKSVHKDTISLRSDNKHKKKKEVRGVTTLKDENTLLFTPSEALESGTYKVKVEEVKLQGFSDKHKSRFKESAHKMCSYFYDDAKECFLYRYASSVKTKDIKYSFNVEDNKPKIISIALDKSNIQLNENNQTTLSVSATYDDNSTVDITDMVEWIMSNSSVVSIAKNIVTPLAEGSTTLQANYDNQTTLEITVTVYKEINGYRLPPEPDPTLNNSTLLGIDVNNNGVRDDVERYVIQRYSNDPEFPKTKTALAMQYAWSTQKILENPTIDSKKYSDDAIDCQYYWFHQKQKDINQRIINLAETDFQASIQENLKAGQWQTEHEVFADLEIKDKIYNTRERIEQKFSYNAALSGSIFNGRSESLQNCQINIDELGE